MREVLRAAEAAASGRLWLLSSGPAASEAPVAARRVAARARLDAISGSRPTRLTRDEINAMVESASDVVTLLSSPGDDDKGEPYAQLGLRLTYHPTTEPRTVTARAEVGRIWTKGRVRGGT